MQPHESGDRRFDLRGNGSHVHRPAAEHRAQEQLTLAQDQELLGGKIAIGDGDLSCGEAPARCRRSG